MIDPNALAKGRQLIRSRKFWASALSLAVTVALWRMHQIDGAQLANAIGWITGVFVGSVAVEDGLSNLFHIWIGPTKDVITGVAANDHADPLQR